MSITFTAAQARQARYFVQYTLKDMAQLCATHGWDQVSGQSIERLQSDLTPATLGYRRSMVVGRQLFCFSHAYRVTADPLFQDRARRLFDDLTAHFWDADNGGWFFSLDLDNSLVDPTKDLYGHAFILFGLAHYFAVFQDRAVLPWMSRTRQIISAHFALPSGWFAPTATREWTLTGRNLEQNPHMHLLEAYLSAYQASRDEAYLRCAGQIMSIYTELLRTPDRLKVLEHLDDQGQPAGEKGALIQPGHLYEWFWLICEYADIAGYPAFKQTGLPIIDWANNYGLDHEAGGIFDLIDATGRVISHRKRIWPMTERIKALTTLVRQSPSEQIYAALNDALTFMHEKYFGCDGSWHEYLNRQLEPDSDFLPLSTPYHVTMAALEVEKLLGGPGAFGLVSAKAT